MGETTEKCAPGAMKAGMHVRHKSGTCGEVKSIDDGMAEVDTHDEKCSPTGVMKSYACKDLAAYDDDGDEDDGMKTAKPEPREGSPEEEASETPAEEAAEQMEEEDGEAAEAAGFRRGHHVAIKAPHYKGVGVVQGVYKRGHVPNVQENIRGTEDEPAARVEAYKAVRDGHEGTGDHIGVQVKHLAMMAEPMKAPSKPKAAPPPKTKTGEPLPALVPLTPEQEIELALAQLTPASIGQKLAAELDQRMGVI